MSKCCSRCGASKPLTAFNARRAAKDGRRSRCRSCQKVDSRAYDETARDKNAARRFENREAKRHYDRARYLSRCDDINAKNAERYKKRRTIYLEQKRAYYRQNTDRWKANLSKPENREASRVRAKNQKAIRRAMMGAPVVRITSAEWRRIAASYSGLCAYCYQRTGRLTMDHVQPLTRGGAHEPDNIVPCCRSCNSKKNNRSLLMFLATYPLGSAA